MDRKKNFLELAFLVVILIMVLGYYGYSHFTSNEEVTDTANVTETIAPQSSDIATQTTEPTSDIPIVSDIQRRDDTSQNENTYSVKADEYYADLNNSDGVHTVPDGEVETEIVDGIEIIKNPKEGVQ